MEIKVEKLLLDKSKNELNFSIPLNSILSILNFDINDLDSIKIQSGKIKFKRISIHSLSEIKKFKNNVYVCRDDFDELFNINIMEDINFKIKNVDGNRLYELFKKFNLDKDIIDKTFSELSTSEKKKILLICALLSDKEIIVFEEPQKYLDYNSIESFIKELKRLKREKIIIISTNSTEFALMVSDIIMLINQKNNVIYGDKYTILSNEKILSDISLNMPEIIKFINKVKSKKNIKLGYRDNINDTVKDVYRHV